MNQYFTHESLLDHLEMHSQIYELMVSALKDVSLFRAELTHIAAQAPQNKKILLKSQFFRGK
jgi:hypothetical protein